MALTNHPRRGGILSGLLFSGFAVVVLIIAAGLFIARNVRIQTAHRNGGDNVSIETPGGHFSIRAHENLDPSALDLPVYPGSRRSKDSGMATFEWTSADGKHDKGMAVGGASMITDDSEEKVLAWYRGQLPNWLAVTDRDGSTRFELNKGGFKRIIVIHEKSDGTHIGANPAISRPRSR